MSCKQLSRREPRSPTAPRVEASGRTVPACPTPSRKHSTNQPGTRAEPARQSDPERADFVGSVACPWRSLGMPRCPPSPGSRAGRPPGQAPGDKHAAVRAGLARAGLPRGVQPPLPAPQEPPTPPGSQDRAAVGDGVDDQGDAQQPRAVASSTSDATRGRPRLLRWQAGFRRSRARPLRRPGSR